MRKPSKVVGRIPWARGGAEATCRLPATSQRQAATDRAGLHPAVSARIAVIGTFGNANMGDDSLLAAFLHWIRGHAPATEVIALTPRPESVTRDVGIAALDHDGRQAQPFSVSSRSAAATTVAAPAAAPSPSAPSWLKTSLMTAVPGLWSRLRALRRITTAGIGAATCFPRQVRVARSLDGFIVLGGGQIFDHWGGPWGHPLTLFGWSLACRISSVPFLILSVGGRPLRHRASARFWRQVLATADYVSLRDPDTLRLVQDFGFPEPVALVPDLAFGLDPPCAQVRSAPRVIGVSPMAYVRPGIDPEANDAHYWRYIDVLAILCERLHEARFEIVMFPSQTRSDQIAIDDLLSRLSAATRASVRVREVDGVNDLLRCISETDAVVATRFHGVLLSLVSLRPVVSISYQPRKNDRLLEPFGLTDLGLAIDGLDADALWRSFQHLVANYDRCSARIAATLPRLRDEVHAQYRHVFAQHGWPMTGDQPGP